MSKDFIKLKITRENDGTSIETSINGFTPNEFREAMFNVIMNFTEAFNKGEVNNKSKG